MATNERRGTYLGILFFQHDLIPKIVPGAFFLGLVWYLVLDTGPATMIWNGLKTAWPSWLGVILIAYLIGLLVEVLTAPLIDLFAKLWYWLERKKAIKTGWKFPKHPKTEKWSDFVRWASSIPETYSNEEWQYGTKVHIESKCLFSTAILLLFSLILVGLKLVDIIPGTSVMQGLAKNAPKAVLVYASLLGLLLVILLILAAWWRQRRRLIGLVAVAKTILAKRPEAPTCPSTPSPT